MLSVLKDSPGGDSDYFAHPDLITAVRYILKFVVSFTELVPLCLQILLEGSVYNDAGFATWTGQLIQKVPWILSSYFSQNAL